MKKNTHEIGCSFEQFAGKYLENQGYHILEYNFRCKSGEVDIIAEDGEFLVFCEVKYRKDDKKGSPLEAVTLAKQRRISKTAMYYVTTRNKEECPCRFDVVGITGNEIELIKNAFDYIG